VKRILMEMEDQKQTYEQKAREALQKLLEEKLQAEQQLQNTQRTLVVTEDDCALWKEHYDTLKAEWSETASKHTELENKLYVLQNQLQWADTQNDQLHQALRNLESEREDLSLRIEALQIDSQLRMEHISAMEGTDCKGKSMISNGRGFSLTGYLQEILFLKSQLLKLNIKKYLPLSILNISSWKTTLVSSRDPRLRFIQFSPSRVTEL
uniref:TRAF3 interacting protein 3 n=1 Tax=Chelydra serpentina TaxID=8475 RepID=A0A8C3RYG6_CHESE